MARKAQLYLVDYLAPVEMPDPKGKGELHTEFHNKRVSVISRTLANVISHVCNSRHIATKDILAINRADEIELDDDLFSDVK